MDIFDIIAMIGGLALFLYGMNLMGSGLKKLAGGKLQNLLEKLSSTPIKGLLLGTVVTAVIQSSSATTVMVVGFVNSGIMMLRQAIGVIMGANIGTTATSWILSLSGISGDNVVVELFKPSSFSPIICLFGVILAVFMKKNKTKQIGSILFGFGILMYGMTAMSSAANPLAESETFRNLIGLFGQYPVLGILLGIVMTAIMQSSSASVGVLQALALTGSMTYPVIIPLILGIDIGACVPVLISSIGANKNGKRSALVYLYFNLIGSAIFLLLFYSVNAIVGGFSFMQDGANTASTFGIAIVNTAFKVIATLFLLPLTGVIEKLTVLSVPDKKKKDGEEERDITDRLDVRFLNTPDYALKVSHEVMNKMGELDVVSVNMALDILSKYDDNTAEQVIEYEDLTDQYEDKLGTYLMKLSDSNLSDSGNREVSKLLHSLSDFERVSDHARNLALTAREIKEKKIVFSAAFTEELGKLSQAVREVVKISVDSFISDDIYMAQTVEPLDDVIDEMCENIKTNHIDRLRSGDCSMETGFILNDILTNSERISGHCSNIAVNTIRLRDEMFDTHNYLKKVKVDDETYRETYGEYAKKYLE